MPNFGTTSEEDEESNKKSVVSQWENLADSSDSESDEKFVEMSKPVKQTVNTNVAAVRKVVGQLKSEVIEEAKKPETWAKAVTGVKNPEEILQKINNQINTINCDKENLLPEKEVDQEIIQSASDNDIKQQPIWILPPAEENKARRRKKGKKKVPTE